MLIWVSTWKCVHYNPRVSHFGTESADACSWQTTHLLSGPAAPQFITLPMFLASIIITISVSPPATLVFSPIYSQPSHTFYYFLPEGDVVIYGREIERIERRRWAAKWGAIILASVRAETERSKLNFVGARITSEGEPAHLSSACQGHHRLVRHFRTRLTVCLRRFSNLPFCLPPKTFLDWVHLTLSPFIVAPWSHRERYRIPVWQVKSYDDTARVLGFKSTYCGETRVRIFCLTTPVETLRRP